MPAKISQSESHSSAIGTFLQKFRDWKFCPPSSNLWTIEIKLHNDGDLAGENDHSLKALYENILAVNDLFNDNFFTSYNVKVKGDDGHNELKKYIDSVQNGDHCGFFLANNITVGTNSVQIKAEASQSHTQHSGWLSYGKAATGRDHNHAAVIQFYTTNWDINELFFDKWIAAIGQQGLVEGDDNDLKNIKADIFINEWAASIPNSGNNNIWHLRKQILLTKVIPYSRDQYSYTYTEEDAGLMKPLKVNFQFENYAITYEDAKNTRTNSSRRTTAPSAQPIVVNTNTTSAGGAQMTNMYSNAQGLA